MHFISFWDYIDVKTNSMFLYFKGNYNKVKPASFLLFEAVNEYLFCVHPKTMVGLIGSLTIMESTRNRLVGKIYFQNSSSL